MNFDHDNPTTSLSTQRHTEHDEHEFDDNAVSVPLGVGEGENDAFSGLGAAHKERKLPLGHLLIVGVLVVAGIALVSMRALTRAAAFVSGNIEMERTVEEFLTTRDRPENLSDNGSSLVVINEAYTERQVPLRDVQKNPFVLESDLTQNADPVDNTPKDDPEAEFRRQQEERRQLFERAAESLSLKSVMMVSNPIANISGNIVRVGDPIFVESNNVQFTVKDIRQDEVILQAEAPDLKLRETYRLEIERN